MPASTQQFTLKTELKRCIPFKNNVCHTGTTVSCTLTNNTGSLLYDNYPADLFILWTWHAQPTAHTQIKWGPRSIYINEVPYIFSPSSCYQAQKIGVNLHLGLSLKSSFKWIKKKKTKLTSVHLHIIQMSGLKLHKNPSGELKTTRLKMNYEILMLQQTIMVGILEPVNV